MKIALISRVSGVGAAAVLVAACQSAEIEDFEKHHDLSATNILWVEPFDMQGVVFEGDHGDHTPGEIQSAITTALLHFGESAGMQARATDGSAPGHGILVRGRVIQVEAGSGAARYWAGLYGAGQSKLVSAVELIDLATSPGSPAYTMRVVGGSKGQGGIFGAGYRSLADCEDAAEQIVEFISAHRGEQQ